MDEMNEKIAGQILEQFKELLTEMEIDFEELEQGNTLKFDYNGEDSGHRMYIELLAEQPVLRIMELLPFDVDPAKGQQMMHACNVINNAIVQGSFVYDMNETVFYSINHLFLDSIIGREALHVLLMRAVQMVEQFDDRFVAINKGYLLPENIMQGILD